MTNYFLQSWILILAGLSVKAITTVKHMSNFCNTNQRIFINDSIVFKLTNQLLTDEPEVQLHCTSDLVTESSRRLIIHFVSLSISIENDMPDNLHIYDFDSKGQSQMVTPASGLFGVYDKFYKRASMGVGDYVSTGNHFRLTYVGSPTLTFRGFDILITSFKDVSRDGSCPRLFGKCTGKNLCVPYSVWCDEDENCGEGDVSDEESCNEIVTDDWKYTYAITMAVVTAIIAIVFFLTTIGIVICLLRKYNRRNYMRSLSITVSAKKDGEDWKITNDLGLTLSMAPPLYDDIVTQKENEPPPSYDTLRFKQTTDNQEQSMITNECITVACIETLNPSSGYTDDVLCEEVLGPGDIPVSSYQETSMRNKLCPLGSHSSDDMLNVASSDPLGSHSSNDLLNVASSENLVNSDLYDANHTADVKTDGSEVYDENSIARTAETEINASNKTCSKTSSQCSMETGFASMESNSSSSSEGSPRHDGNDTTSVEDQEDINERSLLVRYKKLVSRENEGDIQFIDELTENSNVIN